MGPYKESGMTEQLSTHTDTGTHTQATHTHTLLPSAGILDEEYKECSGWVGLGGREAVGYSPCARKEMKYGWKKKKKARKEKEGNKPKQGTLLYLLGRSQSFFQISEVFTDLYGNSRR